MLSKQDQKWMEDSNKKKLLDELTNIRDQMATRVDKDGYFKDGYIESWHDRLNLLILSLES